MNLIMLPTSEIRPNNAPLPTECMIGIGTVLAGLVDIRALQEAGWYRCIECDQR
jgi:hypothetical protein